LLLGGTNLNAVIPALYKNLDYDPSIIYRRCLIAIDPGAMVVGRTVSAKTVNDLVRYAKNNPGKLKYGQPRLVDTFSSELLKVSAGIDVAYIPIEVARRQLTICLAGKSTCCSTTNRFCFAHPGPQAARAGGDNRDPLVRAPDVPTMNESGLEAFRRESWYGLLAQPVRRLPSLINSTGPSTMD